MTLEETIAELERLGDVKIKKRYVANGAREPLFGVATGRMKPLSKKIGTNADLAERLYATGNYDAMYFAGIIADAKAMTKADFERWIDAAYFPMLHDFVVAVTLAESPLAQPVADGWIAAGDERRVSAGWSCYQWLLGWLPDEAFDAAKLAAMLEMAAKRARESPDVVKAAIRGFVAAVGVSFLPLHEAAIKASEAMGDVEVSGKRGPVVLSPAHEEILKAREKGRLGFKRRAVRC